MRKILRLRVVQAGAGDCMILEFGSKKKRYVLIDGGTRDTYREHLKKELRKIKDAKGSLDLMIVSHVDNDHINGLCEMLQEMQSQAEDKRIPIGGLWHNAFIETIEDCNMEPEWKAFAANIVAFGEAMPESEMAFGIEEGDQLRRLADGLKIRVNEHFGRGLIRVDKAHNPVNIDNLSLRIVGPTKKNLQKLCEKWKEWQEKQKKSSSLDTFATIKKDYKVPNLSSIVILAEADGKKLLLTGDGRGDNLLQGLRETGLLKANGKLHVDLLKLPHHGSDRNVTEEFFEKITADKYVISANGCYGNPDFTTLEWLVKSAKKQKRRIEIIVTNETDSDNNIIDAFKQLREEYDPDEYHYTLTVMSKDAHSMVVDLSP